MNMKKGQAAMEFLMTYGWAILVVLAAIGALAYFGVLSPDKFLPDKCTASPPFSCSSYKLSSATGTINLTLGINGGVDSTLNLINISCDGSTWISPGTVSPTVGSLIQNGNSFYVTWSSANLTAASCGATPLVSGSKFKATYVMFYTKSGESVSHTATGSIQARVE